MKIAIIGTGYVGLVTGTCFSEMGNSVVCIDNDKDKVDLLNKGIIPIYEPGLDVMVQRNSELGNLKFTTDLKVGIEASDIVFIAVGTPMGKDGAADLQYVKKVANDLGRFLNNDIIVVDKSTVPVGTAEEVYEIINNNLRIRDKNYRVDVVSNPEFLKEGDAINDFMKPDRVVIGANSDMAVAKLKELYSPFFRTHDRFITMDVRSAEMTKYAANAMLATKISFMNEVANICERVGANVNMVRIGIGSDKRIGYSFIYPGIGYGGTCFPKDIAALRKMGVDNGYEPSLIKAVQNVNSEQKKHFVEKILKRFNFELKGKTFAVWGLSFKPGTDDMREAPSTYIVRELIKYGAKVNIYDPKAMEQSKAFYLKDLQKEIRYKESKYEALKDASALILLTEWKEFRSPDFCEVIKLLDLPVIFDGRNQYKSFGLEEMGIEYYQIGVQP